MPIPLTGKLTPSGGAGAFKLYDAEDIEGDGRVIVFPFPDESLSATVFVPRPSMRLLSKLPVPTAEGDQRFSATAGTAGSGTNTIVLESTTTNPFTASPSWTIQATAALNALQIAEDTTFGGWKWNPATEYLRVRCSVLGTAPKDVVAYFEFE